MKQNLLKMLILSAVVSLVALVGNSSAAEWYKGQLHCHSSWSDGNTLPELAISWYKDHGFHFMCLSDHNVLQIDPNAWRDVSKEATFNARGEVPESAILEARQRFGLDWVETKEEDGKTRMRLKTFDELAAKLNVPGQFLLIRGHEQNVGVAGFSLHANAINITESIPFPNTFPSVAAAALAWRKATLENSTKNNLDGFWMLNHPDWPYYDNAPEELIEASDVEFYENNMAAGPRKRQPQMPDTEKYWDIVNAFRLLAGGKPVYSVATDDTHNYLVFRDNGANPGQGWVVVRSETLQANDLFQSMKKGDFYSSCGVVLKDVRFDSTTKTLTVEVDPAENVRYTIRFVGTKKGFDPKKEPVEIPAEGDTLPLRKTFTYSDQIGMTFKSVSGTTASYQMQPDDMYVRAIITSDRKPQYKDANKPEFETAWTQPVGW